MPPVLLDTQVARKGIGSISNHVRETVLGFKCNNLHIDRSINQKISATDDYNILKCAAPPRIAPLNNEVLSPCKQNKRIVVRMCMAVVARTDLLTTMYPSCTALAGKRCACQRDHCRIIIPACPHDDDTLVFKMPSVR